MSIGSISNTLISAAWSHTGVRAPASVRRDAAPVELGDEQQPINENSGSRDESVDTVELSPEARDAADNAAKEAEKAEENAAAPRGSDGEPLTPEEEEVVDKLRQRDQEVRTHEQAHVAAGGQYVTGGPNYTYQRGPDGNRYAVGGEVSIDASPVQGDPEATIRKMAVIRSAALAPAEPSAQDRAVAAAASQHAAEAQAELAQAHREDTQDVDESDSASPDESTADATTSGGTSPYAETLDPAEISGALIDIAA